MSSVTHSQANSKGWLAELPPVVYGNVLEVMRGLRLASDRHLEANRKAQPRYGEVAIGCADVDGLIKGEGLATFLLELGKGATPQAAMESAKAMAELIVSKHNNKGTSGRVTFSETKDSLKYWEKSGHSFLEGALNTFMSRIASWMPAEPEEEEEAPSPEEAAPLAEEPTETAAKIEEAESTRPASPTLVEICWGNSKEKERIAVPAIAVSGGLALIYCGEYSAKLTEYNVTHIESGYSVLMTKTESAAKEAMEALLATSIDWLTDFTSCPLTSAQKLELAPIKTKAAASYEKSARIVSAQTIESATDGLAPDLLHKWALGVGGISGPAARVLAVLRTSKEPVRSRNIGSVKASAVTVKAALDSLVKANLVTVDANEYYTAVAPHGPADLTNLTEFAITQAHLPILSCPRPQEC